MQRLILPVLSIAIAFVPGVASAGQQPTQPGWPQPINSNPVLSYNLIDQLEERLGDGASSLRWDAQGWVGNNKHKFWYKTEGETNGSLTEEAELQALYDHPVSRYFDVQAGVRYDFDPSPSRGWAAFGIQGLAPYFFDIEATAFVSNDGYSAARFIAEYDWLFTQRLILQPEIEANLYSKSDPRRRVGAGLSDLDVGLRLRYEISRKFAPYVGLAYEHKYGVTADYAHADGDPVHQLRFVVGIRAWF
ncbi:MAG TPA: copper resistance protein B [Gammaproteobacteria bacterium]|nr:copper resistance protein B [Gammaproteobacteria bacterium]